MKLVIKILIGLGIGFFLFLVAIVCFIFYESRKDVSKDPKFSQYLRKPLEIKSKSLLRWNKNKLRFCNYSLHNNEDSDYNLGDIKSVKKYAIGDYIIFDKAMRYKNMHVGETYYLLGKDTLLTGEVVEFEYYTNSRYSAEIWETEADFLKRIKTIQ